MLVEPIAGGELIIAVEVLLGLGARRLLEVVRIYFDEPVVLFRFRLVRLVVVSAFVAVLFVTIESVMLVLGLVLFRGVDVPRSYLEGL